tara:strand:- start:2077 stop:2379 length:303 start_codon:yes stop_codon:yes gene_type:complete
MGCNSSSQPPETLLKEVVMSNILLDVHLLESKINTLGRKGDTSFQIYDHFEKLILEKHGVDSLVYTQSLAYYMEHPSLIENIYTIIIDSLVLRESTIRNN